MNNFFVNVTNTLKLKPKPISKSLDEIISSFENHISVTNIHKHFQRDWFQFEPVTEIEVRKIILNIDTKKSALSTSIPGNILKDFCDTYLTLITKIINKSFVDGHFPDELKLAEVIPVFKKANNLLKENYRPISLLSHMSKVFETIVYNQLNNFMQDKFSPYLTSFRKNHNTQHSLMKMLEIWKKHLDQG